MLLTSRVPIKATQRGLALVNPRRRRMQTQSQTRAKPSPYARPDPPANTNATHAPPSHPSMPQFTHHATPIQPPQHTPKCPPAPLQDSRTFSPQARPSRTLQFASDAKSSGAGYENGYGALGPPIKLLSEDKQKSKGGVASGK